MSHTTTTTLIFIVVVLLTSSSTSAVVVLGQPWSVETRTIVENTTFNVFTFNGLQYIQFMQFYLAAQPNPFIINGHFLTVPPLSNTVRWNTTFLCDTPPPLILNKYSGPFVRNRVTPVLNASPGNYDSFQTLITINDPLKNIYGFYFCSSLAFKCHMLPIRSITADTTLFQMVIYPSNLASNYTGYTSPINITVSNSGRATSIFFPPLVTTTTSLTKSYEVFDYNVGTGLVPTRVVPNFSAMITSTPDANYFIHPNSTYQNDILFYYRAIKPVMNTADGHIQSLVLAAVRSTWMQLLEITDRPLSLSNYTRAYPDDYNTYNADRSAVVPWLEGKQFTTSFDLPSYRYCNYSYGLLFQSWGQDVSYPFGVTHVDRGNFSLAFTFYANSYVPIGTTINLDCYFARPLISFPPPESSDLIEARIEEFEFKPFANNIYLVRAHILDDLSGFGRLLIYFSTGEIFDMDFHDIYAGDKFDGYYERVLILNNRTTSLPLYSMYLMDRGGTMAQLDFGWSTLTGSPLGMATANYEIGVEDLTVFYFDKYVMDVSNGFMSNLLYLASPKIYPEWVVAITFGATQENPYYEATGFYDYSLGVFVIPFTIPARTMTHQLQYYISIRPPVYGTFSKFRQLAIPSLTGAMVIYLEQLYKQFPNTSIINVISTFGDEMPPMITNVRAFPSVSPVLTVSKPTATAVLSIGWNITIVDQLNGFLRGVISVSSDRDGLPRTFEITPNDRIAGTSMNGTYQIMFNVTSDYGNQTFTFMDIELFDTSMNRGKYTTYERTQETLSPIAYILKDPLQVAQLNINLTTSSKDITPPSLESLELLTPEIDVGTFRREVRVEYTVRDAGGMSPRHMPCVCLTGYIFELVKLRSTLIKQAGDLYTYSATVDLPYGFASATSGYADGKNSYAYVSVYGLIDKSHNTIGYSTDMLPANGRVNSTLAITYSHDTPIIESCTVANGLVTVVGKNFGDNATLVDLGTRPNMPKIVYTKVKGSVVIGVYSFNYDQTNPTTLILQVENRPGNATYNSNVLQIQYYPPAKVPQVQCPGTPPCSNNGVCSPTFGCQCSGTWYGDDCSSQAAPNTPVINPDTPTTVYTFNISGMTIVGEIEIVRVRVLDQLGAELASYPLGQWNTTITSNQSFDYLSNFGSDANPNNMGTIKVSVRWFTEDEDIKFAGDVLPMKKNTIKYTILVSNYTFPSQLDSMQVVMRATINTTDSNSCSVQQYGYTDGVNGNKDNLFWMRVKVQSYSVYGHFIQKAMVDGRVSTVSNALLNDTTTTAQSANDTQSSTQTFIGINVPWFATQVIMDPDFQLLLDTDDANTIDGALCQRSSSSAVKLSPLAIAGIVVLSVAIVAATATVIAIRLRTARKQKIEVDRINLRMSGVQSSNQVQ
ncbi:hypothetical protein SAMD00019534_116450 [Acytostelium subglobosum LB1]|uniref:hypothetical protein n=1 Tax=Acytostelium subglobosum LB1 TaxID=1410327 RepID=UPI000644CE3A|nr:hypothetical protein SAMD00019534_116450 [Acytostelium subglobosum LB1]GAM28469.1 hypothetical protein SAMD00019534_116450 [Acytostelium subglobosum LB1]|eukprot:XP_012748508.1 hypothetical protein SAMD00019534_116450 [Acytostelium subglobosum LB1]